MSKVHNHDLDPTCREYFFGGVLVGCCLTVEEMIERAKCVSEPLEVTVNPDEATDVNPSHYSGDLVMRVIEERGLDFALGNTVKYVCRAGSKGDKLTDLKKALWYLERSIAKEEAR